MTWNFHDPETEEVWNDERTARARRRLPLNVWRVAQRKLDQLDHVTRLDQLKVPPGNRLEALSGDRGGQHSIRINRQYRICFVWTDRGPGRVEITDYH